VDVGDPERDADIVVLLHSDKANDANAADPNSSRAEILLGRHRNGQVQDGVMPTTKPAIWTRAFIPNTMEREPRC